MRKTTLATFALLVGAAGLIAACTTESTNAANTTAPDGGADAGGTCTIGGSGIVNITITGLPDTVKVDPSSQIVHFKGKTQTGGAAVTSPNLATPSDQYDATADIMFAEDPIVRTAYAATITPSSFCVGKDQTVSVVVTYAPIPSSNKLWTTNDVPSQLLGFASSTLGVTGTPAASVAIKSPSGNSIAFDAEGNMWTLNGTVADAPIQRYAASSFAASGDKTPDRTLMLDPGCIPGLTQLAFSPTGELYVSSACGKKVSRLPTTAITASGTPTPDLTLTGLDAPEGMAFDKSGNLWVADSGKKTIARFDAASLTGAGGAANLVVTPKTASAGDLAPQYLAFAPNGDLWASSFGGNVLYRLTSAEQAGSAAKDVVPSVQIVLPVNALPEGLAFDESGALWVTLSAGKIGRLSATQLATSTAPGDAAIPEVILTSTDIGYSKSLAFYPPPANSPIFGH